MSVFHRAKCLTTQAFALLWPTAPVTIEIVRTRRATVSKRDAQRACVCRPSGRVKRTPCAQVKNMFLKIKKVVLLEVHY